MDHSGTIAGVIGDPEEPSRSTVRGSWLTAARTAWFVVAATALIMHVVATPLNVAAIAEGHGWRLNSARADVLQSMGISVYVYSAHFVVASLLAWIAFMVVAVLIFWRKSNDLVAILVSLMLISYISTETNFTEVLPGSVWRWPIESMQALGEVLSLIVFYIFPDGRFVPRWTRWLAFGYAALVLIWLLNRDVPYNAIYGGTFNKTPIQSTLLTVIVHGTGAFAVGYRFWRTKNLTQRRQIKWVIVGLIGATIAAMARYSIDAVVITFKLLPEGPARVIYDMTIRPMFWLSLTVVPICFLIAILRFRLWDIAIIINRTLVYGALTVSVIGIYILIVGSLGALLQARGNLVISLIATGLVAVLFHPLHTYLQHSVSRLMYGERDEPYTVLARLGRRLEATLAPGAVLPIIVQTVREALRLPYVAIALWQGTEFVITTEAGDKEQGAPDKVVSLPVTYQGETVGHLRLAPRAPGETFNPADQRLLNDLVHQAGAAVHAVRLTENLQQLTAELQQSNIDLQRSREQLVTAREEERRRLRRDLHDGLGPQLATLILKLETARNRLADDPIADALLADLTARTQTAITDIRRLVYALVPPILAEFGLVVALHEVAAQHSQPGTDSVQITVDVPDCLPPLPAAVEVAAYRIVQEALTNVVRHAGAHTSVVRLTLDEAAGWLWLEIEDDGRGLPAARRAGVGFQSMRERAEELGESCEIESVPGGGTRVRARLPLS
jgi:signal transduction histidine kinase